LELSDRRFEVETKRRVFEKVRKRMAELTNQTNNVACFCPELNPDVIVISSDQSFLLEPQNSRVVEWMRQHFGLENLRIRDRTRVHPSRSQIIIRQLKAAGFEVGLWWKERTYGSQIRAETKFARQENNQSVQKFIFPPWWGIPQALHQTGILAPLYLRLCFWEIDPQAGRREREPRKASRNPERACAATPN